MLSYEFLKFLQGFIFCAKKIHDFKLFVLINYDKYISNIMTT